MLDFSYAQASEIGNVHRYQRRNNQDGSRLIIDLDHTVAIVTDGCGSQTSSEVGARMGAHLLAGLLAQEARLLLSERPDASDFDDAAWKRVEWEFLKRLANACHLLGPPHVDNLNEFFLFTVVGAVILPNFSTFFACGDGAILINGDVHRLGPFPDNAPPYPAYRLLGPHVDTPTPVFPWKRTVPTAELERFLITTDGAEAFFKDPLPCLPGTDESIGSLRQFVDDDQFFLGPDAIGKRLELINRNVLGLDTYEFGRLDDDFTLIAGRRTSSLGDPSDHALTLRPSSPDLPESEG